MNEKNMVTPVASFTPHDSASLADEKTQQSEKAQNEKKNESLADMVSDLRDSIDRSRRDRRGDFERKKRS